MSKQAPDQLCERSSEIQAEFPQALTCEYNDTHWVLFVACFKKCSHPNSRAVLTNPFLFLTTTVLIPGEEARDSAAPPITITTAFPLPLFERRWTRLCLLTGQRPDQSKTVTSLYFSLKDVVLKARTKRVDAGRCKWAHIVHGLLINKLHKW